MRRDVTSRHPVFAAAGIGAMADAVLLAAAAGDAVDAAHAGAPWTVASFSQQHLGQYLHAQSQQEPVEEDQDHGREMASALQPLVPELSATDDWSDVALD